MTDSQILFGIMQNDERVWRNICRNMKPGFSKILAEAFPFSKLANEDVEDIFQDSLLTPMQKIKLNARGREIVNQYVLSYQTNLSGIGQVSEHINKTYKPKIDYRTAQLDNSLGDGHSLEIYGEVLEDSEDAYVKMQTSQVGRYFEQFCWLGGDYWKIIVDRKRGIIYREYGSI